VSAVFSHGRLRLYLLKLLAEGPKHGYELIRLLENRFLGLYAPSAGTIYPRLARMEADGLVTHTQAGGRKVYEITAAGRSELAARGGELAELEAEIHASVADLSAVADEMEKGVRGSVRDLKRELRQAARAAQAPRSQEWRQWREGWERSEPPGDSGGPQENVNELERKTADLLADVRRWVRAGRASADDLRVAVTVVDSVRDQLRRLLRG
jgi:DNA-binding PadR family transcriptional regulator